VSLRLKLVLTLVTLSVAVTGVLGVSTYRTTRGELLEEVDRSLEQAAAALAGRARSVIERQTGPPGALRREPLRASSDLEALMVLGNGVSVPLSGDARVGVLPVTERALGSAGPVEILDTVDVAGVPYRVLAARGPRPAVVQVARDLSEVERVLGALRTRTLVIGALVASVAAAVGSVLARQFTRPIERLAAAAEEVRSTGRLDLSVPESGGSETSRLGASFNEMLAALAASRAAQQQLVQDAGHELRTPLTSIRTNVYALRQLDALAPVDRDQVLADLESETEELSSIVDEIVEVATETRAPEPEVTLDLGALVERVAERVAARSGRPVSFTADESVVVGRRRELERVVTNLIGNSVKFDLSGTPIDVSVRAGVVVVADHGPGFDPSDLPRVFDRFYRADSARASSGSGLGLAIVRQIVEEHGGSVAAANSAEGGAMVRVELPLATHPWPSAPI